jgi:hypothetical protein
MRRATSFGVLAMCAALTVACGSNRTAENNNNTGANAPAAATLKDNAKDRPAPVDVQGCLTASGDRFVLTSLQAAEGAPAGQAAANGSHTAPAPNTTANGTAAVPTTETYQLVATADNDLKQYVGKQVRVTGEADPPKVAEVRELTPAAPANGATQQGSVGTTGNDANRAAGANEPKVSTAETTHFEVRKLRVSAVTPSGGDCPAPAR